MAREWFWMLAFFSVWATTGVIIVGLMHSAGRVVKIRLPGLCYSGAVILSGIVAIAALFWIDCAAFASLPFANRMCRFLGF